MFALDTIRTVEAVIGGRVQGVGYRDWTLRSARRLDLNGHVRNRADGTVEAVFSGTPDAVSAILAACREGPPGARVTAVSVTDISERPEAGFRILAT